MCVVAQYYRISEHWVGSTNCKESNRIAQKLYKINGNVCGCVRERGSMNSLAVIVHMYAYNVSESEM